MKDEEIKKLRKENLDLRNKARNSKNLEEEKKETKSSMNKHSSSNASTNMTAKDMEEL